MTTLQLFILCSGIPTVIVLGYILYLMYKNDIGYTRTIPRPPKNKPKNKSKNRKYVR